MPDGSNVSLAVRATPGNLLPDYAAFLASKSPRLHVAGFEPDAFPVHLFDYQQAATAFCLRLGRAALFLDCVAGETMLDMPGGPRRIDELAQAGRPIIVYALSAEGTVVQARATSPFRKGRADLYRYELVSGRIISVTQGHRFLTDRGWVAAREVKPGARLLVSEAIHLPSISEPDLSGSLQGGRSCEQTLQGSPDRCSDGSRHDGGQLLLAASAVQEPAPSQADAHALGLPPWLADGREHRSARSRPHLGMFRPSRQGSSCLDWNGQDAPEHQPLASGSAQSVQSIHTALPAPSSASPALSENGPHQSVSQYPVADPSDDLQYDTVVSVKYLRTDEYYDLHVPGFENYFAHGICSHNTGLGKTACELEFAAQCARRTSLPSLILTPLAVARQIEREGMRWGYEVRVVREQDDVRPGINVCNYDRLDKLDPAAFGCVVLDESGILKSFMGRTTQALISMFARTPYRLAATATPAPNDHVELGTHAEFLGVMPQADMLVRWFVNDSADTGTWRLKGHAARSFWDWCASWAAMAETPEDLGFDGSRHVLPEMVIHRHKVAGHIKAAKGDLFAGDMSATSMHAVKRQTAQSRAADLAEMVRADNQPWLIWVDINDEADAVRAVLPDAMEVRGSMKPEVKEQTISGFLDGSTRVLIGKASALGYGLNMQNCAAMAFLGRSFSYEQWYQAVRRCWRFGQTRPVHVHLMVAEGEDQIGRVLARKADGHAVMKQAMRDATRRAAGRSSAVRVPYQPRHIGRLPGWLS